MSKQPASTSSPVWTAAPRSFIALVGVVLLLTAALGWLGAFAVPRSVDPSTTADATADWLVASAFADGIDPHGNLRELADHYHVEYWDLDGPVRRVVKSPRTPGALVLLYPLSLVSAGQAVTVMVAIGLLSVAIAMIALGRTFSLPWMSICLGIAYATVSGPARWSHLFGTQEPFLLLCVAMFLVLMTRDDNVWAGVWLGLAGTLKLFPLVLLVVMVARRRTKGMVGAAVTLCVLNLAPLLWSHVSLDSTLDAITSTASNWFDLVTNIGLVAAIARAVPIEPASAVWIGAALVAGSWFLTLRRPGPLGASSAVLICIGILALPFAWPHYLLAAVPTVLLALHERILTRGQFIWALLAVVMTIPVRNVVFHTAGLALMAAVLAFANWSRHADNSRSTLPAAIPKPV